MAEAQYDQLIVLSVPFSHVFCFLVYYFGVSSLKVIEPLWISLCVDLLFSPKGESITRPLVKYFQQKMNIKWTLLSNVGFFLLVASFGFFPQHCPFTDF